MSGACEVCGAPAVHRYVGLEGVPNSWHAFCATHNPYRDDGPEIHRLKEEVATLRAERETQELASGLFALLCHEVLEWYQGDEDLMPQKLVDQLTVEAERLAPPRP